MPYGWEGNRSSSVALAMHHRLKWFIRQRTQWLRNENKHPPALGKGLGRLYLIGSRPSDHYFRKVCLLFVCAEFFSAVLDPISIKLGHMLCVWV